MTIIEPLINSAMNAVLLTGDICHLNLARSQLDRIWELRHERDGKQVIPHKHFDSGWADYRLPNPVLPIHLWMVSMAEEDLERIRRLDISEDYLNIDIPRVSGRTPESDKDTKHYIANTVPWFNYIRGENPDYPEQILEANYKLILVQLEKMRSEEGDPYSWLTDDFNKDTLSSIHKWQEMCPVYFEGLLQLTLGAPMHISHGGLQHARVRYYDVKTMRPGLPKSVAALVESMDAVSVTLQLINLDLYEGKELVIQAGAFGEHSFEQAVILSLEGKELERVCVDGKWAHILLSTGAGMKIKLQMNRYVNSPTYETPWSLESEGNMGIIRGR